MTKQIFVGSFLLAIILGALQITNAQTYTVASYNIRFDNKNDTGNLWVDRKAAVISLIHFHDFDIFGTQEGLPHQLADITESLPAYTRYGNGRDDGSDKGEHSAIFYKKGKFTLLASGDFWLSETPDKPGLGWDAKCCNRICSWVQLQDKKSKQKFYFFNVHFDHEGVIARIESSKLILDKVKQITKGAPVILTGDFNGGRQTEWYQKIAASGILRDSYNDVAYPYQNSPSFNNFGKNVMGNEVIDHIFISKQIEVLKWGILTDTYHGKFPSDHFPVEAAIKFK